MNPDHSLVIKSSTFKASNDYELGIITSIKGDLQKQCSFGLNSTSLMESMQKIYNGMTNSLQCSYTGYQRDHQNQSTYYVKSIICFERT